jgi:ferredoxin-type protein NapG
MSDQAFPTPGGQPRPDRRGFFLQGVSAALQVLGDLIPQVPLLAITAGRPVIRPPGALEEKDFVKTCYRCGSCVEACPVHAIRPAQDASAEMTGTPFIDPDMQACTMCGPLECMKACPSGALVVTSRERIRMGRARWTAAACLLSPGQQCRTCLDECPAPGAIRSGADGQIQVVTETCAGCGVCQQVCPTRPKAIRVQPL